MHTWPSSCMHQSPQQFHNFHPCIIKPSLIQWRGLVCYQSPTHEITSQKGGYKEASPPINRLLSPANASFPFRCSSAPFPPSPSLPSRLGGSRARPLSARPARPLGGLEADPSRPLFPPSHWPEGGHACEVGGAWSSTSNGTTDPDLHSGSKCLI